MPASSKLASSATALFAILCLVSAGLQWNDPDPAQWMALYGAAMVLASGLFCVSVLVRLPESVAGFIFPPSSCACITAGL